MYKKDLTLNNPQGLICHKTHSNQTHTQAYINFFVGPMREKKYIY